MKSLGKGNIPMGLVPMWIPDGFELDSIKVDHTPLQIVYKAIYAKGNQKLRITRRDYLDEIPVYVEQSEGMVEEYEVSGITYYLFENNEHTQAVWIVESFECYISGQVTIEELKMMISSIEKG